MLYSYFYLAPSVSMVQLSPSPFRRLSPSGCSSEKGMKPAKEQTGESQHVLTPLQTPLSSASTPFQAYETYVDNGMICLKHKIRNIEKKKMKLDDYKQRMQNGESLNQDQLEAVEKYDEVIHNLEFAKELQKTFTALGQELLKAQKKALRREAILKIELDKKKLRTIFHAQYVLKNLRQEHVQKDFREGCNGASYLSSKELDYLIKFSKLTCPERKKSMSLEDQMEQTAFYFWDLLEGSEKAVAGTTYKVVKNLLSMMLDGGYFESIPVPPIVKKNQVMEVLKRPEKHVVEEEILKKPEIEPFPKVEPAKEPEPPKVLAQSIDKHPCEFLNRRYLLETEQHKNAEEPKPWDAGFIRKQQSPKPLEVHTEKEQLSLQVPSPKPWGAANIVPKEQPEPKEKRDRRHKVEPETKSDKPLEERGQAFEIFKKTDLPSVGENHKLPTVVQTSIQAPKPVHQLAAEVFSTSILPQDPIQRKQKLQDLMAQMQGTYNFMQESLLDYDRSAQSTMPTSQQPFASTPMEQTQQKSMDYLPQPAQLFTEPKSKCVSSKPLHEPNSALPTIDETLSGSEANLSQSPAIQVESPLPPAEELENCISPKREYKASTQLAESPVEKESIIQATVPLLSESPITTSSSSMSPISKEKAFKCSATRSSTAISTTPFQTMQTIFKVNAPLSFHKDSDPKDEPAYPTSYNQTFATSSTQTLPHYVPQPNNEQNSVSHEIVSAASTGQPEGNVPVNSNAASYPVQTAYLRASQPFNNRGLVRGASRGTRANSYRPLSGFKAGFDSYRGGPPAVLNGNFAQPQFSGREYSAIPYTLRDGNYQACYKRGASCGPRGNSRGWSDSSQLSSPERDEIFHSGDSGQGDSRSNTPVDMPVTNQAATLLPVHVYPLPQQMRVAFSTARTSNFAPGTLDQPIAFDLLLNNLGETFDIQLGRFTCPVNGTYVFIFHMLKLAVNVPLYVNLMKNEEVLVSAYANDGAPDHETASNHAILQLFQGDQIWLRLHRGAIYGSSWKYSTFSGYLLYQD
uniref:Caprin-2 n=1 Tax=Geotrypetes seraphini TaxID=260995 RepID=A0A6P8RT67_GEOSA|nr:caprin-2 isoform X3 [Geotrypetes seraphini]